MKKLYISVLTFIFFFSSTHIIKANQVIFSEDFSDSLSRWTVMQSQGEGLWERCSNQGSNAHWTIAEGWLDITLDGPDCTTVIIPNSFNVKNQSAYKFEFDWYLKDSIYMDRNALILWQENNDWYGIRIYGTNIYFEKVIEGTLYNLDNSRVSFPFVADHQYHFALSYLKDKRILVEINNQIVLDLIDQPPFLTTSMEGWNNIGLKASLNLQQRSVSLFDNVVVTTIDDDDELNNSQITQLEIPLFKQNNPLWEDKEYDSANDWSNRPTIKRWGCALSSIAMILNYYNINKLPSGETLNPDTLNNWLKSQPDGYIGEGLLNWVAISRLTRQISNILGTPKLEYSRVGGNLLQPTIEQIKINQPTILNILGHFFVGSGYINDFSDLAILDPIYNYSLFSQHKTNLVSTRIFTPSFTDLSYIMIVTNPDVEVEITNINNQAISGVEQFIETLSSDYLESSEENGEIDHPEVKQYKITQIAKPTTDDYKIVFSTKDNTSTTPINFSLYNYDNKGSATILEEKNIIYSNQETYQLHYQKESTSNINLDPNVDTETNTTITKIVTWQSLLETIENIKQQQLIEDNFSNYLIGIVSWAKIETTNNQKRYISLLNNYLSKVNIDEEIKTGLLQDLNLI